MMCIVTREFSVLSADSLANRRRVNDHLYRAGDARDAEHKHKFTALILGEFTRIHIL